MFGVLYILYKKLQQSIFSRQKFLDRNAGMGPHILAIRIPSPISQIYRYFACLTLFSQLTPGAAKKIVPRDLKPYLWIISWYFVIYSQRRRWIDFLVQIRQDADAPGCAGSCVVWWYSWFCFCYGFFCYGYQRIWQIYCSRSPGVVGTREILHNRGLFMFWGLKQHMPCDIVKTKKYFNYKYI